MKPINAHTQMVGLIGWPIGHSVSPRMHNAAFDALEMDWRYAPLPVPPEPSSRIGEAVHGLRALGFRGANVTIPHKQAVMPYLDEISEAAQAIGAVNTIIVTENGALRGDNTDARGFIADLKDHGLAPAAQRALVLGAGGSARAIVYGLAEAGAESITILNRTEAKATELAGAMQKYFPACKFTVIQEADAALAEESDLVVNCTSVGMTPDSSRMPWHQSVPFAKRHQVYDLVYNPSPTKLVEFARTFGAQAINGKGMLVWQGAIAFESWTGRTAPIAVMHNAIADL